MEPQTTTDLRDVDATVALFDEAATALRASPYRRGSIEQLPARGRLLVTGDLHDNPIHFAKVVHAAGLDATTDHHVLLHELIHGDRLINGMDFSYRMLARTAQLVLQYPGQVHPVLANHELAQMTGRAVTKGGGNSVAMFNDALDYSYGEDGETVAQAIGRFVAAMPLALRSDSGVLCSHSLPNAGITSFDPDVFDRDLTDADYASPTGSAYLMVWGRGYTTESVAELAERWGVSLFCVGHQHVDTGIDLRCERVVVLNTDHQRAMILAIDLANVPGPEEAMLGATPLAALPEPPESPA